MSNFAYTTYQQILSDIRFSLRGGNFDEIQFFNNARLLDDIVIDLYLLPKKYDKKNTAKFSSHNNLNFITF